MSLAEKPVQSKAKSSQSRKKGGGPPPGPRSGSVTHAAVLKDHDGNARNFWMTSNEVVTGGHAAAMKIYGFGIYQILLYHFNSGDGYAWPSYQGIAKELGICRNQVIKTINELVAKGYVAIRRMGNGRDCNHFVPTLPTGAQHAPVHSVDPTSAQCAPAPVHGVDPTSAQHAPEQYELTKQKTKRLPHEAVCGAFNEVWEAYPRKEQKPKAKQAYKAMSPDAQTHASILAGIKVWSGSEQWNREGGKFVSHLSNFLTNRQWEDHPHGKHSKTSLDFDLERHAGKSGPIVA
jgi:biotin operon repressor